MKQSHKTLLLWVLLIVMFLAIWQVLQPERAEATGQLQRVRVHGAPGQVTDVHIKDHEYLFTQSQDGKSQQKETLGPVADQALLEDLQKRTRPQAQPEREAAGLLREGRHDALLVVARW